MKFSLLIANYNNGHFFKDCYNSIIAQTYDNWEAVIIDDGSTDDSIKEIKALITGDTRFKLFTNEKNVGCGYTKRKCVELATGDACGFVDPDDALLPTALQEINNVFLNNPFITLVHSSLYFCDERLNKVSVYAAACAVKTTKEYFNLDGAVTALAVFKRQAYFKTDGIDSYMKRAIDVDLYLKLSEVGEFYFLDNTLYLYRRHSRGISTDQNSDFAYYWHWFAAMQAAKRRNVNIEQLFVNTFIPAKRYNRLKENPGKYFSFKNFILSKLKTKLHPKSVHPTK